MSNIYQKSSWKTPKRGKGMFTRAQKEEKESLRERRKVATIVSLVVSLESYRVQGLQQLIIQLFLNFTVREDLLGYFGISLLNMKTYDLVFGDIF